MKTLVSLLLVSILILWVELQPTMLEETSGKPGICPVDRCRCSGPQPDKCKNDHSCKGKQKCCIFCCAMRCMDPEKVRPGRCPPDYIHCIRAEPNECENDFECPRPQKCCYNACAKRCVNPVYRVN